MPQWSYAEPLQIEQTSAARRMNSPFSVGAQRKKQDDEQRCTVMVLLISIHWLVPYIRAANLSRRQQVSHTNAIRLSNEHSCSEGQVSVGLIICALSIMFYTPTCRWIIRLCRTFKFEVILFFLLYKREWQWQRGRGFTLVMALPDHKMQICAILLKRRMLPFISTNTTSTGKMQEKSKNYFVINSIVGGDADQECWWRCLQSLVISFPSFICIYILYISFPS